MQTIDNFDDYILSNSLEIVQTNFYQNFQNIYYETTSYFNEFYSAGNEL